MTVGVDNTNWTYIVTNIIHDYAVAGFSNATSICSNWISNWWGWNTKTQDKISRGVSDIVSTLDRSDNTATIYQLGYYNPSGTGYDYANVLGSLFPAECQSYVDKAITTLHAAILNGITKSGAPVLAYLDETNQALYMAGDLYQELQLDLVDRLVFHGTGPPPGWPHPNTAGAQRLANMLAIW